MKTFYRVCRPETAQGLWYDSEGNFTGLIHGELSFCTNSKLKMEFDPEIVGWLSATESLDNLYKWFTVDDIKQLQGRGYFIHEYLVSSYKFYDRFQHYIICQKTSKIIRKHIL